MFCSIYRQMESYRITGARLVPARSVILVAYVPLQLRHFASYFEELLKPFLRFADTLVIWCHLIHLSGKFFPISTDIFGHVVLPDSWENRNLCQLGGGT